VPENQIAMHLETRFEIQQESLGRICDQQVVFVAAM
jgi:hypothetical protein